MSWRVSWGVDVEGTAGQEGRVRSASAHDGPGAKCTDGRASFAGGRSERYEAVLAPSGGWVVIDVTAGLPAEIVDIALCDLAESEADMICRCLNARPTTTFEADAIIGFVKDALERRR